MTASAPETNGRSAHADEPLKLNRRADGVLVVLRGEEEVPVKVQRIFPWSQPDRWASLRDDEDKEIALVENPGDLDADSAAALREALAEASFLFRIVKIHRVEEEFEIRVWDVDTESGRRTFQTPKDEWPRDVPGGALLIKDVAGDLFVVNDPEGLDPHSQKLLWALVD